MIYIIALSVIAGALSLYYFLLKDLNYFQKYGIPFKPPLPLLGNMGRVLTRHQCLHEFAQEIYNLHPEAKYVGMFDLTTPIVMIRDPELIKSITLKNIDIFLDRRPIVDENQDPLLGRTLFVLRGDKWRQVRALLSPSFTSNKMKSMFQLMSECGTNFTNYLTQLPPQRIMQMKDIFNKYTNDVIATCFFGVSVDSMKNPENEFFVHGTEALLSTNIIFINTYILGNLPWLGRLLNLKVIGQKVIDFFRNVIETTIKTRDENGIVRPDMLQLLMENRGKIDGKIELSLDDMVAQAFGFFVAGFDVTSSLMCFLAYEIAMNQDVHEELQKEIDQILKGTNGQISFEAINSIEYLDALINETLRKYPVLAIIERVCSKDFNLPPTLPGTKPFTIKKGQTIWVSVYGLHRDPQYYEEPEKFDPARFLGERKKHSLNCGAYLPFGLGPRMCIGNRFALLETKVVLFHLLARCNLKLCDKTQIPVKLAKSSFHMKPEDGIWLKVLPRKNTHHTPEASLIDGTCKI